jgi:hypothetical protein
MKFHYQGYMPYGKGGRCVGLEIQPPALADCLEILVWSTSPNPESLSKLVQEYLYLYIPVRTRRVRKVRIQRS